MCTSPWPCGLVSITYGLPSSSAMCASLSTSAATFSCLMMTIWPGAAPKFACFSSSAAVRACVSSDVMMASGTVRSATAAAAAEGAAPSPPLPAAAAAAASCAVTLFE